MLEHKLPLASALLLLAGCGANPVEKDLSIQVSDQTSPLRFSTLCEDSTCEELEKLHVEVVYAPGLPETEVAELDEYRVDYELDGLKHNPPYFAALKKLLLTPGETATLSLDIAGTAQRSFLIKELGHGKVSGIGHMKFAGYDHDNNQIMVRTQFEIEMGEIALDNGTSTQATLPIGSLDAGAQPKTGTPDAGTY